MGLPEVTLTGRLGADPELRFTASGAAVVNFRVGCTERKFNRDTNQWEDGRSAWISVSCWREMAENIAESLHVGDEVFATGLLYEDSYTPQGSDRPVTSLKMDAKVVGPVLRSATARVTRTQRQGGQQQGQQQGQQPTWGSGYGSQQGQQQGQQQADPWATQQQGPPQGGQQQPPQQGWGGGGYDTPPF